MDSKGIYDLASQSASYPSYCAVYDQSRFSKYIYYNQKILNVLDKVCRCDLYEYSTNNSSGPTGGLKRFERYRKAKQQYGVRPDPAGDTLRHRNRAAQLKDAIKKADLAKLMCRLLLVHYVIASLGLLGTICYQYTYDYYMFHLRKLQAAQSSGQVNVVELYKRSNIYEFSLSQKIELSRANLKLFGSPLMSFPYVGVCTYVLIFCLAFMYYFCPLVYFRYYTPLDFYFVRMMLNWQEEQQNCEQMIRNQVDLFIESSKNFAAASLGRQYLITFGYPTLNVDCVDQQRQPKKRASSLKAAYNWPQSMQYSYKDEHDWTEMKLRQMTTNGNLQPLNRANLIWLDKLSRFNCMLFFFVPTSCLIYIVFIFSFIPYFLGSEYENDPMDLWVAFEVATLNIIIIFGTLFYTSLSLINCIDQVHISKELKNMIDKFITKSKQFYFDSMPLGQLPDLEEGLPQQGYDPSTTGSLRRVTRFDFQLGHQLEQTDSTCTLQQLERYREQVNTDLLYILMHYKIFAAQLRPVKRTFGFISASSIGLMTVFPVLARLHLPYITESGAKILAIFICLLMAFSADCCMMPICWMNRGYMDLYNSLSCLMAHLVELTDHQDTGYLFSKHMVWLLRKELNHPENFNNQFATISMGMVIDYPRMMRIHFWIGLVVLSLFVDLQSSDDTIFGHFLNDPLGIISNLPKL